MRSTRRCSASCNDGATAGSGRRSGIGLSGRPPSPGSATGPSVHRARSSAVVAKQEGSRRERTDHGRDQPDEAAGRHPPAEATMRAWRSPRCSTSRAWCTCTPPTPTARRPSPRCWTPPARRGARARLLTDHDSLGARRDGWEGMHEGVFLMVGTEVSPERGHYLAFGVEREIPHAGRSAVEIARAVRPPAASGSPRTRSRSAAAC